VLFDPRWERRVPERVGLGAAHRGRDASGSDGHVVAQLRQPARDRVAPQDRCPSLRSSCRPICLIKTGLHDPDELGSQLLLLMDGAWVAARMFGPHNPATGLTAAARALIDTHR
jgi:hypothetical protein